ncbi:MAG: Crp/Fnr family transcriptional regulator [Chitinophagales bacterium]|nr:Crp/Fnr family transcriptional regulator [Chitinophagales bacterium]MBP9548981.1 Crp/Fnr family transcriptional regulator [Chitinophagales bacterium]
MPKPKSKIDATENAYAEIDNYINRCIVIDDDERNLYHSLLEKLKVKKKTYLLEAGQICKYEWYVIKGCVRIYYIDDNGFDVNLMFAVEDWWLSDLQSYMEEKPSRLFIQALEDSVLWRMTKKNKEKVFDEIPKFERMFRIMLQRSNIAMQYRLLQTYTQTAEERYKEFIRRYPKIPQRIPQHHIASFLGMSPEFLSKIRNKKTKKKS